MLQEASGCSCEQAENVPAAGPCDSPLFLRLAETGSRVSEEGKKRRQTSHHAPPRALMHARHSGSVRQPPCVLLPGLLLSVCLLAGFKTNVKSM